MRAIIVSLLLLSVLTPRAHASGKIPKVLIAPVNGGFAGILQPDPVITPATRDSAGISVIRPGYSHVRADKSVQWFPAVDTGVIFWWGGDSADSFGGGVGAHIVTYKVGNEPRLSPALTFHAGNQQRQMFMGIVFTQAGAVRLPGGARETDIAVGHEHDFDSPRSGRSATLNFYVGVVVGAIPAIKQEK